MTAKELSQLYYLNREIEQDERRLAELEAAATRSTTRAAGLPHMRGFADKTALAAEIADIRTMIEANQKLCVAKYNQLMRFIMDVDDSLMRQILKLRHVNGLNWRQVARSIGGNNTEDSVRMAHKRFLDEK